MKPYSYEESVAISKQIIMGELRESGLFKTVNDYDVNLFMSQLSPAAQAELERIREAMRIILPRNSA